LRLEPVKLVFFKEFVEAVRDYRTVIPMVFMSLALGPLLVLILPKIALIQGKAIIMDTYRVAQVGDSQLVAAEVKNAPDFKFVDIGSMSPQLAVDKGLVDAAIVIPSNFDQSLESNFKKVDKVDIVYNGTRSKSGMARLRLSMWWDGLNQRFLQRRIKHAGINIEQPPNVAMKEISPESPFGVTTPFMQLMLAAILMMMALMGVVYPALDAITGERERQTLEPLLMTHAERSELFAGKLLTVASTSYISVLLTLLSFFVCQFLQPWIYGQHTFLQDSFPFKAVFPWPCFLFTGLAMLPLCVTLAASALMFSSYAKTIQQGQGYFLPLMLLGLVPLLVVLLGNVHLNASVCAVPFLNCIVAFNDVLSGYIDFFWLIVSTLISVAFCFLAILLVSPQLAREDLLFGVTDSPARRFAANDYRRELLFLCALIFLLMFYGSQVLVLNYHLWGVALTQILIVLMPALIFVRYWLRLPLTTVIKVSAPRGGLATFFSMILMVPLTITTASACVYLQSQLLPGTDALNEVMAKTLGIGSEPLMLLIFVVGILPGICEEILFRGVVLSFLPSKYSQTRLVIIVGTLFGAFHMSILRFLPTAAMGALLTFVRLRCGSIWPAMILHCLHNSFSVVLTRYMSSDFSSGGAVYFFAGGLAIGLLGLCLFIRATR